MTRETHMQLDALANLVNTFAIVLRQEIANKCYDTRTVPALTACEIFYHDIKDLK